jgi:hypothetical protein
MKSAGLAIICSCFAIVAIDAHKPITSKYTYSEDVYPIVKEHCGGCHTPGGIAPMSLLTYEDARPWAESIRLELTTGHMPPWYGDPSVAPLRDDHALSPRDLDVVLTWATGGTPAGPALKTPAAVARASWKRGRPDIAINIPETVTLAADTREDTREFILRDTSDRDRLVSFADVLPGNPAIVHDAMIFTRRAGEQKPATVMAEWIPGDTATPPAYAFAWRAGEQLVVRIHYKKNWKLENKPASDRSSVGLYLAKSPSTRAIRSVAVQPGTANTIDEPMQAVAVRTAGVAADTRLEVDAIRPDGSRIVLAGFSARPGWNRRYWLARAIDLPRGSRLEATASAERMEPIQLFLDVLP